MRELEDILRRESHRARPETPPSEGFGELKSRLEAQEKKFYWFQWLVPLGVLLAGLSWYCLASPSVVNSSPALITKTSGTKDSIVLEKEAGAKIDQKTTLFPSPSVKVPSPPLYSEPIGENREKQALSTSQKISRPVETESVAAKALPVQNPSSLQAPEAPRTLGVESNNEERSERGYVAALSKKQKKYAALPQLAKRSETLQEGNKVRSSSYTNLVALAITNASTLATPATQFPAQKLSGTLRQRVPLSSWDISMSYYTFREERNGFAFQYSDDGNLIPGAIPQSFVIDGEARTLYYVDNLARMGNTRITIGQLKLNRQMANGLRLGGGLRVYRDRLNTENDVTGLVAAFPDSYLQVNKRTDTYLLGQVQLGYTFLRRRRLQPWLSVGIQVPLVNRDEGSTYLLYEDRLNLVSERLFVTNLFQNRLQLYPSLEGGAQYWFTAKFSAGLNIGMVPSDRVNIKPTIGLEARYHW